MVKICVTGAGGFIGSHLAKRLKGEGHHVVGADWKRNEFMKEEEFCDEFHLVDLREMKNCLAVTEGCEEVYNLAADMGGMGFIQSCHSIIGYNNTMISLNVVEAARKNGACKRFFYSSSACVCVPLARVHVYLLLLPLLPPSLPLQRWCCPLDQRTTPFCFSISARW
jgi:GDP-D-mannose 3',5'-epimerase